MKVTLIQMDILWGDIVENCNTASHLIDTQPGSDLYVLPEMFSTGFATEPEGIADDSLQTLKWMQQKANEINAAICGSVATKCDDGTYRNRFYFVNPQPYNLKNSKPHNLIYYDKHHLFTYGNEHLHYTPGNDRTIVEWCGVRFLLQVCYDLRFPCFSRNKCIKHSSSIIERETTLSEFTKIEDLVRSDYDCAIYVASWPTSRIEPWHTLLKARAIENQCYVFGVNRVGTDHVCSYCGGTECIDPYGRVITACPSNETYAITSEIDMISLESFREKFPVLLDADP